MHLTMIDWAVVVVVMGIFVFMAMQANRLSRSVSDYLVAGRSAGRYILTVAAGTEWIGAINIVAMFQVYFTGGLSAMWWVMLSTPVIVYMCVTGWGIYRFRETRAMTIAEFLEKRYSRPVRRFAGILTWVTGMINFGIFPAVSARLFITLLGLPASFECAGMTLSTFPVMTAAMLIIPAFFVLGGGHTTVIVSDFVQGLFMNVAAVIIVFVLMGTVFDWPAIVECLKKAPAEASMLDPIHTSQTKDFNLWFFVIGMLGAWYGAMSNVPAQGFLGAGRTAHEQRMGQLLGQIRWHGLLVFFMVIALVAMKLLQHPADAETAALINASLDAISTNPADEARSQALVTATLPHVLPVGLVGLFGAVLLAALISSHNSFMHAWGGVLLQDVVMPFRSKPFAPRAHIWALRGGIVVVALVAYVFSLTLNQQQNILMYFAMVNSLWLGPAGAVMLGGLYWKRGTARAAMTTLIVGCTLAVVFIVLQQVWPRYHDQAAFPINGQWQFFINICISLVIYFGVSLARPEAPVDMDRLLHRGAYAIGDEHGQVRYATRWWHTVFGITPMFDRGDRLTAYGIVGYFLLLLVVFLVGTAYGLLARPGPDFWAGFWHFYLYYLLATLVISTVWLGIGGVRDLGRLMRSLRGERRDANDDGWVDRSGGHS